MENLCFAKKQEEGDNGSSRIRAMLDVRFGGGGRNPKWWEVLGVIAVAGLSVSAFYLALVRLAVILEALK